MISSNRHIYKYRYEFSARGRLLSVSTLSRSVGVLIAFFGGALIKYEYRPYIFVFIPIIYLIGILSLPNTPQFFLKNDDLQVSNML